MAELELLKIKSDKIKKIDCGEIKDNSYIEEYYTLEQKLSDINNIFTFIFIFIFIINIH